MLLVFGAGGQVGTALIEAARGLKTALTAVARSDADITDAGAVAAVIGRHSPTLVVNAAAFTDVDHAEKEPETAMEVNAIGAGMVAAACERAGLPLIHISTDFVFDGAKSGAYVEEDPVAPLSAYGRSKAEGEEAVRRAASRHVILRSAWIYGGRGRNFMASMLRFAAERDEIRMVSDQRGSPTSAAELAGVILAITSLVTVGGPKWGTYHFAGAGEATRFELAARILAAQARFTGHAPRLVPIRTEDYPVPARRPANSVLDSGRFTATFGIRPRPWQEAVDEAVGRHFEAAG